MNHQFQADPLAIAAGLMRLPARPGGEPMITSAGLFALLGEMAHDPDSDADARYRHFVAMEQVLQAARRGGLDEQDETLVRRLFAEGVSAAGDDDQSRLLALLCRLVALTVGDIGRMSALIAGDAIH
jgi:hypothetical protein